MLSVINEFEVKVGTKYPILVRTLERKIGRNHVIVLNFRTGYRKLIYTTNSVVWFNLQLRKITKTKAFMPLEDALLKLIYLASQIRNKKMDNITT